MPRVLNKMRDKIPDNAVFIGRPSKWGNPFKIGQHGDRQTVLKMYEEWVRRQPRLMSSLKEIRGKDLVCYCSPEPCHGDILMDLANCSARKIEEEEI